MKKKIRLIFIFILALSLLLSACGSKVSDKKVDADISGVPDVSDVTILEKSGNDVTEIKHVFTKGVDFKVDKTHTNAIDYIFAKKDQSIKMEDGNGLVWTLEIPQGALLEDVHITMTALTDIKSGDLGALSGGVRFEPDGLQFLAPAKLTVTGKNLDSKCVLLTGDNSGKTLDFMKVIANDKGVSAEVEHFSGVYAAPSASNSIMAKHAKESLDEAYAEAKALLKKPLEFPAPPAISLKCNHSGKDNKQEIIDKYVEQFLKPEQDIRAKIISAQFTLAQIDKNAEADWSIINRLSYRLVKKSVKLFKTYSPQPDYFMASCAAINTAGHMYSITSDDEVGFLIQMTAEWARKVTDQFLKDLINKHDYEKIHPIIEMGRRATFLSNEPVDNYLKLLSDALQFRVEYENIVNIEGDSLMGYSTEGMVRLNLDLDINPDVKSNRGTGKGEYTGFISPDPQVGLVRPNTYNIRSQVINFLPCQYDNFNVLIDMFGANKEVMTAKGQRVSVNGVVQAMSIGAFGNRYATNPLPQIEDGNLINTVFYTFNLDVHNMNQTAGEKTFKADVGGQKVEFTIRLVHTPNGKGPSKAKDSGKDPLTGNTPTTNESDGNNGFGGDSGSDGSNEDNGSTGGSEGTEGDGSNSGNGNPGGMTTNPSMPQGKLSSDFPSKLIPLPEDAKIMTSSGDSTSGWLVVYTTNANQQKAADFVKGYMKSAKEFQVQDIGTGVSITGVKNNMQIAVVIINDGGITIVSISAING